MELTVSQFLEALNTNLRQYRVTIVGEIAGRINRRGAVTYFSLHDETEEAMLQCMAFNSVLDGLGITLEEGMAVKVAGVPEIWKRSGSFSFKVYELFLTGEGALAKQFEALKKKLEADGLFDEAYKKPLPRYIKHVGLITAEGREAQTDFLTHLALRGLDIELYDVRVEGAQAVDNIVDALEWFNQHRPATEVLVLTRGGGGLESFQAFNSERVARAIFASRIPIICGVGHEKDVSIADFVADVRASTPTHAGKIISHDWEHAPALLEHWQEVIENSVRSKLEQAKIFLQQWQERVATSLEYQFTRLRESLAHYAQVFQLSSPELRLKQGYSITRDASGRIVRSVADLSLNAMLEVQFHHGKAKTKITELG